MQRFAAPSRRSSYSRPQCPTPKPSSPRITEGPNARFKKRQSESRLWKEQERRRVAVYNVHLNGAVIDFHHHILKDEHYLVTNCGICRKDISEIKSYSKKLEQAMK